MDIDRSGLEVLTRAESIDLLCTEQVGHLVYSRRTLPAITCVNYAVCRGAILEVYSTELRHGPRSVGSAGMKGR